MATADPIPPKTNWADDDDDARVEVRDEGNGIQTVVEYRRNANGKQVKLTRRIKRTLVSHVVDEDVAERKSWAKFGNEKDSGPGPQSGTTSIGPSLTLKLSAGASKEPEPDPTVAMREKLANKRVQCRMCRGDHYTAHCPYRDTLEAIPGAGMEPANADPAATAGLATSGDLNTASKLGAAAPTVGKYRPPNARAGAGGPSATMGGQRDESATLRVTNLSELVEEEDLRDLFRRYGRVTRVFVGRDRDTGLCKGFAYVNFDTRENADLARQKLDGYPYDNLILSCQWSQPRGDRH